MRLPSVTFMSHYASAICHSVPNMAQMHLKYRYTASYTVSRMSHFELVHQFIGLIGDLKLFISWDDQNSHIGFFTGNIAGATANIITFFM